jgi:hypothetical protein
LMLPNTKCTLGMGNGWEEGEITKKITKLLLPVV